MSTAVLAPDAKLMFLVLALLAKGVMGIEIVYSVATFSTLFEFKASLLLLESDCVS